MLKNFQQYRDRFYELMNSITYINIEETLFWMGDIKKDQKVISFDQDVSNRLKEYVPELLFVTKEIFSNKHVEELVYKAWVQLEEKYSISIKVIDKGNFSSNVVSEIAELNDSYLHAISANMTSETLNKCSAVSSHLEKIIFSKPEYRLLKITGI
jgi:hypothetical protein